MKKEKESFNCFNKSEPNAIIIHILQIRSLRKSRTVSQSHGQANS